MTAREVVRNPFVWAFVVGAVVLTLIRPLLRHVPAPPPVLGQLPSWSLVDEQGRPFGSDDLKGQTYIVSFFFTRCTSICPKIMHGMARLQQGYEAREDDGIRLVSVTVDPEYDTPEVLREYGKELGVHPVLWTLVTGDPEKVRALVVDAFKTPLERAPTDAPGPMEIAHTGKVVLVDGSGGIRGYYDTDEMGLDEVYNRARHVRDQARGGSR